MASSKKRQSGGEIATRVDPAQLTHEEAVRVVLQMSAQARAFRFVGHSVHVYELLTIRAVKDEKAYEAAGYTWETFCREVLARPRSSVDEDLQNLETFGQEFMELADQLSLGRAAMRSLRRLPEGVQPRVLESGELEIGDQRIPIDTEHQEDVVDLLQDIIAETVRKELQIEEGKEQLSAMEGRIDELMAEMKDLKARASGSDYPAEEIGLIELDRDFMKVVTLLADTVRATFEEKPDPEKIRKWVVVLQRHMDDLVEYFSGYRVPMKDPMDMTDEEVKRELRLRPHGRHPVVDGPEPDDG